MINFLHKIFKSKKPNLIIVDYQVSEEDFEKFIYNWNIDNPVDRWYRQKYGIKFNSPEHRVLSFIDMAFEYREDEIYKEALEKDKTQYKNGDYLKKQEFDPRNLPSDEILMGLDLSNFDDK